MTNEELQPRFIRANGTEFAYFEAGSGPLVLCMHGFPDTAYSLVSLVRSLAGLGFHAVAPFMRGYPPSAIPDDRDYSVSNLGRDVIALIEHFGVESASLVGHDWGAIAAYAAAGLRPDRIRRIVTAAVPHLRRFFLRPSQAQMKASHYIFKFQLPGWPERRVVEHDFEWLRELIRSWSPDWRMTDDYFNPVKAALSDPQRLRAALGYYRAIPRLPFSRETWQFLFKPIQVPALVICGANDGCILPATFRDSEHLYADGYELLEIPAVGHFMHLEARSFFNDKVGEFLKKGV